MNCTRLNHTAVVVLTRRAAITRAPYPVFLNAGATVRHVATTSPRQQSPRGGHGSKSSISSDPHRKPAKSTPKRTVPRILSADVAKFFDSRSGVLATTPANAEFFRTHPNVDHDHGKMERIEATDAVRALSKEYNVRLAWSSRHMIHPYRLRYFDPRGHPLAAKMRSDLARRDKEDTLWAFALSWGTAVDSAVVWQLTKRELLRAVFASLTTLGYDEHGRHKDGRRLKGTLWLMVTNAKHTRALPADRFGQVVADTLDKHYATRPETRTEALAPPAKDEDWLTESMKKARVDDQGPRNTSGRSSRRPAAETRDYQWQPKPKRVVDTDEPTTW
ncbi:hypothetical protein PWT90_07702 [Aphanocladium album]|nr:hypothetical protein PWT90_07702 [Aphanocladium album]